MSFKFDLKIFLFIIVFYFTKQIEIYSYMMFFALVHELGHLLMGIALNFKPKSISATPLGFSISFYQSNSEYINENDKKTLLELKKMIIALAGPLINLIIVLWMLFFNLKIKNYEIFIYSNLLIALFNLLPIYPLDGGRIIKNILNIFLKSEKAYTYSTYISIFFMCIITFLGSLLVYYYKNFAIFVVIIFLWGIVVKEETLFFNEM